MLTRTPRSAIVLVTAALAVVIAAAPAMTAGSSGAATAATAIMPLGDSITDGYGIPGGYRIDLEDDLLAAGLRPNFVGSVQNGPAQLADKDHEGHSGWRIDQIHAAVAGWLRAYRPNVVLLLIGTNDVLQERDVANAPARLGALLDRIHASRPSVKLVVSTIPPLADPDDNAQAATYNAAIRPLVRSRAAKGRPIFFVDGGRRLALAQLDDGVHPNASGYSSLADSWRAGITAALRTKSGIPS